MKSMALLTLTLSLWTGFAYSGEDIDLNSEVDRINYSIGYQIGGDLHRQNIDINTDALVQGASAGAGDAEPLMSTDEMESTLIDLKKKIVATQQLQDGVKEQYRGEGRAFLAANAQKTGIVTLPSGLQYKVIRKGTGPSPGPHDEVTVDYKGTLIDGREFDSSYRRGEPATFRVDGVIPGWTEGLQLMQKGAKWQLFIPADLGYGERGPLADQVLIFDVELLDIKRGQ